MLRVPDHVPPHLVLDFDYRAATTGRPDPYEGLLALDRPEVPSFFYTPANGGHWVARTYEHVSEIFRDHARFATYPSFIPPAPNQPPMIPIQIDPPEHGRYKRLLGPLFSPAAAARLETEIRKTAVSLIEPFAARGACDFVKEYAQLFPQHVFLRFMGMPVEKATDFVEWAKQFLVGATPAEKSAAGRQIVAFIEEFVDRESKAPSDDWAGFLIRSVTADGEAALTRQEIINICYLLFLAGLDTATNAHAHAWRYLAHNPEAQGDLRTHPERIPLAMEELLRFNAITNNSRRARSDMDFHGVHLRQGDAILLVVELANRDPAQFADPNAVRLDREDNLHLTFGAGIHRCIGSNLARTELRVSLEEWQRRIPEFRLGDDSGVRSIGGVTMGLDSLPLVWDVPA